MTAPGPAPLMSTDELAAYLKVSSETIRYWRQHGTAPKAHRVGKYLRFRPADVEAWLEERASTSSLPNVKAVN